MFGSMAIQWQGLVLMSEAHITTREHGEVPCQGSCWGLLGCPRGCTDLVPPLTGCGALEKWLHLSGVAALGRVGPLFFLDSTMELALEAGVQVSRPQGHESRRADPASC